MSIYWWFLIPAIFWAAFSGPIDAAVKTDRKLKKVILVFSVGVALVCGIAIIASLFAK